MNTPIAIPSSKDIEAMVPRYQRFLMLLALLVAVWSFAAIGWWMMLSEPQSTKYAWVAVFAFTLGPAIITACVAIHAINETNAREKKWGERLGTAKVSEAISMQSSPEIDDEDRDIITQWLNANQPGWSFGLQTSNTTR